MVNFQIFFEFVHVYLALFKLLLDLSFSFDRSERVRLALNSVKLLLKKRLFLLSFRKLLFNLIDLHRVKVLQRWEAHFQLDLPIFKFLNSGVNALFPEHGVADAESLLQRLSRMEVYPSLLHLSILI
tara:strand:+ start:109 stop:489 length:381 start_codon:yes stop_codon:yes gene_type:complete